MISYENNLTRYDFFFNFFKFWIFLLHDMIGYVKYDILHVLLFSSWECRWNIVTVFEIDFGCDKVSPLTCSPSEKKKKLERGRKTGWTLRTERERERKAGWTHDTEELGAVGAIGLDIHSYSFFSKNFLCLFIY